MFTKHFLTSLLLGRVYMNVCLCSVCVYMVITMLVDSFKTLESNKERIFMSVPPPPPCITIINILLFLSNYFSARVCVCVWTHKCRVPCLK